jgi:hypothetical protein
VTYPVTVTEYRSRGFNMSPGHYWVRVEGRGYFVRFESQRPPKWFTHQHLNRANCFASAEDAWHVAEQLKRCGREASVVKERPAPPPRLRRCRWSLPNGYVWVEISLYSSVRLSATPLLTSRSKSAKVICSIGFSVIMRGASRRRRVRIKVTADRRTTMGLARRESCRASLRIRELLLDPSRSLSQNQFRQHPWERCSVHPS